MKKLSETLELDETYIQEEPPREEPPKSEEQRMLEKFVHDKTSIIKTWLKIDNHPEAKDFKSEVGSAFDEEDLDEEMAIVFEAIGEGGIVYCSFEKSFWVRHKDQLIRVM